MTDLWTLAPALGVGCLLGAIFYGGLWWTVQKGLISKRAALWFFASFWLRLGIALTGFYFVANGDWKRMLMCLAGFIIARFIIARLTREHTHAH